MNKFAKFPLVLGIVGVICTGALSLVYEVTKERIAYNKNKVAIDLLSGIVTDIVDAPSVIDDYDEEMVKKAGITNIYEVVDGSGVCGYGYQAEVAGYNPGITFLLVLDNEEYKILGFNVISHAETNSGTYGGPLLNSPEFAAQFTNISFDDVASEVDYVAGSTAKVTLGAVKSGVDNVIAFHKQAIFGEADDGINLTSTERKALGLAEGAVMTDITEEFATNLKANVSANMYDKIMNVEAVASTQYTKIWNFVQIADASGNVTGNAIVASGSYNCEVEHGKRAWQEHKFVVMFDTNGANTKVVVVKTTDSLGAVDIESLDKNSWVNDNFNGKTMVDLNRQLANGEIDKISGASYTTPYFIGDISTVIDAYIRAYGK